jgi:hypothetical protein
VATAPRIGGAYTVVATVTGPASTAIAAGATLKKAIKIHLDRGQVLRFSVTGAPASGTAQLYAKGYPAGTGLASDLTSTT